MKHGPLMVRKGSPLRIPNSKGKSQAIFVHKVPNCNFRHVRKVTNLFGQSKNRLYPTHTGIACHFISCSSASNSGVPKNSPRVISKPSQSFLSVTAPGFLLSPFRMLLMVAWGTAEMVLSLLGVIPCFSHRCLIRLAIASLVSMCYSSGRFITDMIPHLEKIHQ